MAGRNTGTSEKQKDQNTKMAESSKFGKKFSIIVAVIQLLFIVLFGVFVDYEKSATPLKTWQYNEAQIRRDLQIKNFYSFFQNIHVMIFFGIGFLYSFMKKYCYTGVTMCMLLAALTIQTALLIQNIWRVEEGKILINIVSLIMAEFAGASSLIALGGVFGKVSPLQMVVFVIAETVFYSTNEHYCFYLLQVRDIGESVALHLFAALFGLSVAFVVDCKKKVTGNPNEITGYTSNIFCLVGTMVLWTLWPSFNAAIATGDSQQRAALNTFLALIGSGVSAFFTSTILNKENKFSTAHIQNATLAGGVAVGSSADLLVHPAGALAIGCFGGIISVIGFEYVSPFLYKYMKVYDPCGINCLHAIPGFFGGIFGAIIALTVSETKYGYSLYELYPAMAPLENSTSLLEKQLLESFIKAGSLRSAPIQAGYQLAYVAICMISSVVSGLLTGLLLRLPFLDPLTEDQMYTDEVLWDMSPATREEFQSPSKGGAPDKF